MTNEHKSEAVVKREGLPYHTLMSEVAEKERCIIYQEPGAVDVKPEKIDEGREQFCNLKVHKFLAIHEIESATMLKNSGDLEGLFKAGAECEHCKLIHEIAAFK